MTSYGKIPRLQGLVTGLFKPQVANAVSRAGELESAIERLLPCHFERVRLDSLYFRGWIISELVEQKRSELVRERAGGLGCGTVDK